MRERRRWGPSAHCQVLGAIFGLVGVVGLGVLAVPAALASTATGTASGGSAIHPGTPGFNAQGSPCVAINGFVYNETGSGTYSAVAGAKTITYSGPLELTLTLSKAPAYAGPFGSFGYDSTCEAPHGTPFDVSATTKGTSGSASLSCAYSGTLSRTNPTGGNGTDKATATLSGSCTLSSGGITVSNVPATETRHIAYINGSCNGRPPTACKDDVTLTAQLAPAKVVSGATTTSTTGATSTSAPATTAAPTTATTPTSVVTTTRSTQVAAAARTKSSGLTTLDLALIALVAFLFIIVAGFGTLVARQRAAGGRAGAGRPLP